MPPLTTQNTAALVGGGTMALQETVMSQIKSPPPATLKGTVARAFYFQGKVLSVGEVHELPRVFALEMQAARKFTISAEPDPAPVVEEPAADTSKPGSKKGRKESDHAG